MSKKIILIVIAIIILGGIGYFAYQLKTEESTNKAIQKIFVEKYPNYAETLSVNIEKETKNHIRGNVNFVVGAPGGLFLAVKSDDKWQIVHEGNGQIPCSLSSYGFPADMLSDCATTPEQKLAADAQNATYMIEGEEFTLVNGKAEKEIAPGSASKIITLYFGNDKAGDLNGDGRDDVAFLLTQNSGGSGTFYYVAVAINKEKGYQGTNAILLGDRIAPQTTEIRDGKVIVNYADRKINEAMVTPPSIGITKQFALEGATLKDVTLEEAKKEQACALSGGTINTSLCCTSVSDFPNLCLIGACGCSPDNSHQVKTCDCGEGQCFDENGCIVVQ